MKKAIIFLSILTMVACQQNRAKLSGHQLESNGDQLTIKYGGEGDVVQFKMFEGLHQILKKNDAGIFEGQLTIPDLDDGIFTYDILVHKKDANGKMINLEYTSGIEDEPSFLWIGKNRNVEYTKAVDLEGKLTTKDWASTYLEESRKVSIYTPKQVDANTPIIYMTDGSNVDYYAPYIDTLISEEKIRPIKLVGVHSSRNHRYDEYVFTAENQDYFNKHQDFFFKEVMTDIEKEINGWQGQRYLYGVSNGAAFCLHVGLHHPDKFAEIIAFSTTGYISGFYAPLQFNFQKYPKFYMGAGKYEESIFNDNLALLPKMKEQQIDLEFKTFIAGHDYSAWKIEFFEYLEKRFKLNK